MCVCIVLSSLGSASSPQTISVTCSIQVCPAAPADWQFLFGSWPFLWRNGKNVLACHSHTLKSTVHAWCRSRTLRWNGFLRQTLVIWQSLPGNRLLNWSWETSPAQIRMLYDSDFSKNMKGGTERKKCSQTHPKSCSGQFRLPENRSVGSGRRPSYYAAAFLLYFVH